MAHWKAATDGISVCLCILYRHVCACWYHAGVSSSWAHFLTADVACWSSCHVELLKDNTWPCRHDMDTSPLQRKQGISHLRGSSSTGKRSSSRCFILTVNMTAFKFNKEECKTAETENYLSIMKTAFEKINMHSKSCWMCGELSYSLASYCC